MTATATTSADPLGPDSLTWKYFGDLRTGMMGVWIGAIQNMYPELGAGVEEHSILLREPLQRVARSVYPIMGVVYDGDRASETGQQIKGYHRTIKGVDAAGRRYHALNPETFYWAHATFFMLIIKVADYFCGGLTEAEKRQLFDEHVQWYRMYGMSMRPVPRSWEELQEYWDRVCRNELEINQATLDIFKIRIPKPTFVLMPTPIWDRLFKPLVAGQRWIAAGLFEPAAPLFVPLFAPLSTRRRRSWNAPAPWCTARCRWPVWSRPGGASRPPEQTEGLRALVQADRRGGGHVQALGAAGHRDAHAVIRGRRDLGRQAVCLGAEQPGRRRGEVRLVQAGRRVDRAGQHPQPGGAQRADGSGDVGRGNDRNGEDAARRRAQALAVVRVDAMAAEDHGPGAHGVGDADQGASIAGLADLDGNRYQPGRGRQHVLEPDRRHVAHRHQPRRAHRVRQRFCSPLGDQMDRARLGGQQGGVPLRREFGDEHVAHQPASGRGLDQVGALGEESSDPPAADVPMQFDRRDHPGRAFRERRRHRRALSGLSRIRGGVDVVGQGRPGDLD